MSRPAEFDVFHCPLAGARLIEASAGTGKTWNICGLYLRLLLEARLEVDRILVVTFTNAATAELRERIRARMVETLDCIKAAEAAGTDQIPPPPLGEGGGEGAGEARLRTRGGTNAKMAGCACPPSPLPLPLKGEGQKKSGDPFVHQLLEALDARGLARADLARRLELALAGFDEAAIHTIHGYCQRALADTPFGAGLPLSQELIQDDGELVLEAARDYWRRHVAGDGIDPALAAWLMQQGDSPEHYARLLKRHLARPLAPHLWPPPAAPVAPAALAEAYARARATWLGGREAIVARLLAALGGLHANSYKPDGVRQGAAEWDALFQYHDPLAPMDLAQCKLKLYQAGLLAERSKKGHTPPEHPFFHLAQAYLDARVAAEAALERARLDLIRGMLDAAGAGLRADKRARRRVAFDDMLTNLHERLMSRPGLARTLRERYPAALIDEFQDTDPLQFAIFGAIYLDEAAGGDGVKGELPVASGGLRVDPTPTLTLPLRGRESLHPPFETGGQGESDDAGNPNAPPLFLVGDPKQAIYSFRNADLHTYLSARARVSAAYTLAHNQRSAPGLIDAVNRLFQANPRAFLLPGLDFHPAAVGAKPRKAFVDHSEAEPEATLPRPVPGNPLWVGLQADSQTRIESGAGPEGRPTSSAPALRIWRLPQPPLDKPAARRAAAHASAAEIARLLNAADAGRITLDGRPLRPGDVAVLVRSHRQGGEIKQALAALGIGSVELAQASVYASPDAEEVERLLAAIREPNREGLMRAALATELMGRTADDIAALDGDEAGLAAWMLRLGAWRELWQRRGVGVMYRQLLATERVAERMLARPDGERRLTNLLHLGECLHQAAGAHPAPDALLRWFQGQRRDDGAEEAAQLRLESDRNLVQIVTIHKSKGLEYPVVFCPYLWDGASHAGRDLEGLQYHDDAGRSVVDMRGAFLDAPQLQALKDRMRLEAAAEDLRLIYVAMTRAVHRCYLVAGGYSVRKSGKESARGPLNWLAAGGGQTPEAWFIDAGTPPEAIDAAWAELAASAPGHIALTPLPETAGLPYAAARPAPDTLAALSPPAGIPEPWRMGSYSGLIHGASHEAATEVVASDHDARLPAAPSAAPAGLADDDILRFPRGAEAGECLHHLMEHADFTAPAGWGAAIAGALRAHPQSLPGLPAALQEARLARMLRRLLADLTRVELPDGIRLDRLPWPKRLTELEFHLPAQSIAADALNRLLDAAGYAVPRLAFGRLTGYLKGFIDLVFEHDGRYYLLDWKSNHLGHGPADYALPALEQAMAAHGYHLQQLIYAVALHRYLARRLADYDYRRHFGGSLYLFVRGTRPDWRGPDGAPAGVYFHRPAPEVIDRLDALLGGFGK